MKDKPKESIIRSTQNQTIKEGKTINPSLQIKSNKIKYKRRE